REHRSSQSRKRATTKGRDKVRKAEPTFNAPRSATFESRRNRPYPRYAIEKVDGKRNHSIQESQRKVIRRRSRRRMDGHPQQTIPETNAKGEVPHPRRL
ncbi:Hypothetical predicted protein, partial [Paramuricea clavata]